MLYKCVRWCPHVGVFEIIFPFSCMDFWYLYFWISSCCLVTQPLKVLAQLFCLPTCLLACLTRSANCSSCFSSLFLTGLCLGMYWIAEVLHRSLWSHISTFFPLQALTLYPFPHFLLISYFSNCMNEGVCLGLGLLLNLLEDLVRRLLET